MHATQRLRYVLARTSLLFMSDSNLHQPSQVLAKIGLIELPRNLWPDLVEGLLKNMSSTDPNLKQSTLETLGYICEEIV